MALQSSGAISIADINTEFGRGNDLNSYRGTSHASGTFSSGAISFNDFYGKSNAIAVNVSFTQCVDHYATVYYDGNGNIRIQSREPSGNIHTGRGDCGGNAQGDITRYTFSKSGRSTINVTISSSGRNGSGSITINQSVNSTYGPTQVGATDSSGGAAGYSFTIVGTIT